MNSIGRLTLLTLIIWVFIPGTSLIAKVNKKESISAETFKGLALRNIGPAFMSGRIADIDIDPNNTNIWYVAVGSGGVWKTKNAGTTWEPLFDDQSVYSIGTVTVDPNNSSTIWVGSGENVGGRHVGFGDGVYVSHDAGVSWQNKGLEQSEHISEIIIHPTDSNIIWVASQGPLWSKGGQRGLYKSIDGGTQWIRVLGDDQWVGVSDVLMDPRNPDRLYAATWQRQRSVAALLDGGPGSGIHRSEDGGDSWVQLHGSSTDEGDRLSSKNGLPTSDMGKIGLALSPMNPDVIYAAIELNRRKGAVYRSDNRGATWSKGAEAVGGGTGPHYYQELYASPHNFDQLFLAGPRMMQSNDGGKTFKPMAEKHKHSDNHALSFDQVDKNYLLMGSDGGLYESRDRGENWRFISNLPITQFYKLAVDDSAPFYRIYGGTQDNGTQGGPSRTDNIHGIRNSDWEMVLFADGHQPAVEPGNPNIVYSEWQQGNLVRVDRLNKDMIYIQPQPEVGDPQERFNWDAPILISPHKPTRLYYASQRVWRSENRGDTWTAISPDLTHNRERIEQPIMDNAPGWDAAWDMWAMSTYSTITSLAESPLQEGLLYAGTDDGLIQISSNGGEQWTSVSIEKLPGVPGGAFINDIKADLYDADTVYVALDNHKMGDYQPYLYKSIDRGKSWKSIASDLPEKHLVWRLVQDHVNPDLLFVGTEFGLFFTVNGGGNWYELNGGVPTISFRDIAIQRRENDLVAASFGRGFFILDDYSPLRSISKNALKNESILFPTRKAWWYIQQGPLATFTEKGAQGSGFFTAPNPPFGAVFTYYLKERIQSKKELRQAKEKTLKKDNQSIVFPGWNAVEAERRERDPKIWLTIKNSNSDVVRRISGSNTKGFNRVAWDLSLPRSEAITQVTEAESNSYFQLGFLNAPGDYSVSLSKEVNGQITLLQGPQEFIVEPMGGANRGATQLNETVFFWKKINQSKRDASAISQSLKKTLDRVKMLYRSLSESQSEPGTLDSQLDAIRAQLLDIEQRLNGHQSKFEVYLSNEKTIDNLLFTVEVGTSRSLYGPTETHRRSLERAITQLEREKAVLKTLLTVELPEFEKKLQASGAPWVSGQRLP